MTTSSLEAKYLLFDLCGPQQESHKSTRKIGLFSLPAARARSTEGMPFGGRDVEPVTNVAYEWLIILCFQGDTDPMARSSLISRIWIVIVSIAVLAMPVSAAHLHLCFDGNEPPATLHASEHGAHHSDSGASAVHHDVDVSLASSALAKKYDASLELPGLIASAFVILLMPHSGTPISPPDRAATLVPSPQLRLLPPLRAPPV